MKFNLAKFTLTAFAFLLSHCANAQSDVTPSKPALMPEEEALKKLIAIALDPKDNGLQLVDTFSRHSKYLITNSSTIRFPNAIGTAILSRNTTYEGNTANIRYIWTSKLKEIPQKDSAAMYTFLGRLQEIIARALPDIRDSFYHSPTYSKAIQPTWLWKPGNGISFELKALTGQNYNLPNEIKLQLSVNKKLIQNKNKIIDSLFNHYQSLAKNAPSRNDAIAYSLTLFKALQQEGLTEAEAIAKFRPVFKAVSDKDMTAGFNIMMQLDEKASTQLKTDLSPEQLATVRKLAQGVVDDFNAKYYGTRPMTETATTQTKTKKPAVESWNAYYTNATTPNANSKYVYIHNKDTLGNYKIQTVWITPKRSKSDRWLLNKGPVINVTSSYFSKDGSKWMPVHIGHCVGCGGSGVEVTRTPYTYYREEKGIYNKYTYSGTGVNVSSKTCGMCYGQGYSISKLQW